MFSAQSRHKVAIKGLAGLCSQLEFGVLFKAHSGCWQNSLPCCYGTEVLSYEWPPAITCHVAFSKTWEFASLRATCEQHLLLFLFFFKSLTYQIRIISPFSLTQLQLVKELTTSAKYLLPYSTVSSKE